MSEIAYATVYKLMDCLTSNFEPDKLQPREHLLSLCASLLQQTSSAELFWESEADSGIHLTVGVALRRFPLDFQPLTRIVTSLASASPRSCEEVWKFKTSPQIWLTFCVLVIILFLFPGAKDGI